MNIIFYIIITFLFYLWYKKDKDGGWLGMGIVEMFNLGIILLWFAFTAIWGGIFWW